MNLNNLNSTSNHAGIALVDQAILNLIERAEEKRSCKNFHDNFSEVFMKKVGRYLAENKVI